MGGPPEPEWGRDRVDALPIDPDLAAAPVPGAFGRLVGPPRRGWPRIHGGTVGAVFAGAFVGGLARYLVGLWWPTPAGAFPWGVFWVNTSGAFILALLLVTVLEVMGPSTYLRPVVGTGFCGALTTFSSVATGVDQLIAHGRPAVGAGYLAASLLAGLGAASAGILVARSIAANRQKGRG